jgi:hypothetical protein
MPEPQKKPQQPDHTLWFIGTLIVLLFVMLIVVLNWIDI